MRPSQTKSSPTSKEGTMRLLVDTHVLLWAAAEPGRLSASTRERLESPDNEVLFSAASIWELAIKLQIGRLKLPVAAEEIVEAALRMGFDELPVTALHAAAVGRLPLLHRDPFDRILVTQAIHEPARFLTVDRTLATYSVLVEVIA
jgi:PIN domain nuclease of toxin-antitoxin system